MLNEHLKKSKALVEAMVPQEEMDEAMYEYRASMGGKYKSKSEIKDQFREIRAAFINNVNIELAFLAAATFEELEKFEGETKQ